jgi:hypothetical protein
MRRRTRPLGIANFDSASVMLRALARFLDGKDFPALGQPRALQQIVRFADYLRGASASALSHWAARWKASRPMTPGGSTQPRLPIGCATSTHGGDIPQ